MYFSLWCSPKQGRKLLQSSNADTWYFVLGKDGQAASTGTAEDSASTLAHITDKAGHIDPCVFYRATYSIRLPSYP